MGSQTKFQPNEFQENQYCLLFGFVLVPTTNKLNTMGANRHNYPLRTRNRIPHKSWSKKKIVLFILIVVCTITYYWVQDDDMMGEEQSSIMHSSTQSIIKLEDKSVVYDDALDDDDLIKKEGSSSEDDDEDNGDDGLKYKDEDDEEDDNEEESSEEDDSVTESSVEDDKEDDKEKESTQPVFNSSTKKSGLSDKNISQQCKLRDLSHYSTEKVGDLHEISLSNNLKTSNCLFYVCNRDAAECDNKLPTNFDGPKPPCCTHILRDMSRNFDEAMCTLGLDYVVSFGTLLGFRRGDHIIPWTADIDYIIPSKDVANEMVALWDTNNTGMAHIFQGINRMCVTPDFAGGALQRKWSRLKPPKNKLNLDTSGLPYIDFYVGSRVGSTMFQVTKHCSHFFDDVFPTKRKLVYNYTFSQNFPANSDQLLRTCYGKDWRTPPKDQNPHGGGDRCYGPFL